MSLIKNPRLQALAMVAIGAVVIAIGLWLGDMAGGGRGANKAIVAVGLGGVAVGLGLVELIWPPPRPRDERDERHFFARASWPQKVLYTLGGLVGVVAAAILQTVVSGKI